MELASLALIPLRVAAFFWILADAADELQAPPHVPPRGERGALRAGGRLS